MSETKRLRAAAAAIHNRFTCRDFPKCSVPKNLDIGMAEEALRAADETETRSQHTPPLATEIRFLTRERDAAIAETLRMQTLIAELREEVHVWRGQRNDLAAEVRAFRDRDTLPSDWPQ